jgi:hypothetical protein
MPSPRRAIVALLMALFVVAPTMAAQSQKQPGQQDGTISGRVSLEGKPAASVFVSLHKEESWREEQPLATTTTDREGNYRIGGLAPGRYRVQPYAAGYVFVNPGGEAWRPGKAVSLAEGDSVEGVDLDLVRGGVITGRVTDSSGRAIISQHVRVERLGEDGSRQEVYFRNGYVSMTDDRGLYRLFSVPAGRYLVSIGMEAEQGALTAGGQGAFYPKTYHPATSDASSATIVEVSAGSEAKGVDIVAGKPGRTFRVTGRVVEAESGKPVPNVTLMYGVLGTQDGREFARSFYGGSPSNAKGEFQFGDLSSGRYSVMLSSYGDTPPEYYSDPVNFEIAGADVTGLEIKVHPGATLSGTVTIEGSDDPAAARTALSQIVIVAARNDENNSGMVQNPQGRVQSDGSFRIGGVKAGDYLLHPATWRGPKGYSLARVERDGGELRGRFPVAEGEKITGLRVVMAYGTGVIKGQVKAENGSLSETAIVWVRWRRTGTEMYTGSTRADARRQFLIDGLSTGEYDVNVRIFDPKQSTRAPVIAVKSVSVTSGATAETTITVDLTPNEEGEDK